MIKCVSFKAKLPIPGGVHTQAGPAHSEEVRKRIQITRRKAVLQPEVCLPEMSEAHFPMSALAIQALGSDRHPSPEQGLFFQGLEPTWLKAGPGEGERKGRRVGQKVQVPRTFSHSSACSRLCSASTKTSVAPWEKRSSCLLCRLSLGR